LKLQKRFEGRIIIKRRRVQRKASKPKSLDNLTTKQRYLIFYARQTLEFIFSFQRLTSFIAVRSYLYRASFVPKQRYTGRIRTISL